nr:hypothetical protein [Tanacetum cinerariifolium]
MGKTISELPALLIEYEKGLPKKTDTPQVMAIQGGRFHKAIKKSLNVKGKGKGKGKEKDKSYIPKPKNPKPSTKKHPEKDDACHHYKEVDYGILVSNNDVLYFNAISCNGLYEIDMRNSVPNVNSINNVSNKRVRHNLDSTYMWHCRLVHISKKCKMTRKTFPHRIKRATDLLGLIHIDVCDHLDTCQDKVFKNKVENQLGKTKDTLIRSR